MTQSPPIPPTLQARLLTVRETLPSIIKTRFVDAGKVKFKYAELIQVAEAIDNACKEVGLTYGFTPPCYEVGDPVGVMKFDLIISCPATTELERYPCSAPCPMDMKGFGSASTYLKRYSLFNFFMLVPEDDDGQAAVQGLIKQQEAKAQGNKPAPSKVDYATALIAWNKAEQTGSTEDCRTAYAMTQAMIGVEAWKAYCARFPAKISAQSDAAEVKEAVKQYKLAMNDYRMATEADKQWADQPKPHEPALAAGME
jgi:hypothetical protein